MVKTLVSNSTVVSDYLNNLLMDTQLLSENQDDIEPSFRFAKVEKDHELVMLWKQPSSVAQAQLMNLTILSLVKDLTNSNLKAAMLKAIENSVMMSRQ